MQLFKRVLLSLFPDHHVHQSVSPASMFVSFIATKEFFSVIHRKIVENHKLNLFDITRDPIEYLQGFGGFAPTKQKDIDSYYSYTATANINGYRLFNPANIANSLSLAISIRIKPSFTNYDQEHYLHFLYTIYLLVFVFSARIKVFPFTKENDNYNWFIDTFFAFYEFIFLQTGKPIDAKVFLALKKDLLRHTDIFFLLFSLYQKINKALALGKTDSADFYRWLFADDAKGPVKTFINAFIEYPDVIIYAPSFSSKENALLQSILPADILLRYLFLETDMFLITDSIVKKLFDTDILAEFFESFTKGIDTEKNTETIRKHDAKLNEFLLYITDYRHYKKNFFEGIQKYLVTFFKREGNEGFSDDMDELDELMSSIGEEDADDIENLKIPERIKRESKIMEKILNFYVTFIGGFWIARGETGFFKLFKPDFIKSVFANRENIVLENPTLLQTQTRIYYTKLLYFYEKNNYYYKHITNNVRLGKQRFSLPHKTPTAPVTIQYNTHIIKLFDEAFLSILLQDCLPKDIRIYVKNKIILNFFKDRVAKDISTLVRQDDYDVLTSFYTPLQNLLPHTALVKNITEHFGSEEVYTLKEHLYTLDVWIHTDFYHLLNEYASGLSDMYEDRVLLGFFAQIRETLFGFLLFTHYIMQEEQKHTKKYFSDIIDHIYLHNVLQLNLPSKESKAFISCVRMLYEQWKPCIEAYITLDDNQYFLGLGLESWIAFIGSKDPGTILTDLTEEDTIRFSGFLKNISYYNKRFLLPK